MKFLEVEGLGQVSRVGLGTWQFGSREWGYGERYATGTAADIVVRARELGVTLFDTAEAYGFGNSERILVIPGASSVEQLECNVAAAELELDADSRAALTAAARAFTPLSAARTLLSEVRGRLGV